MNDIVFRAATAADRENILALRGRCFPEDPEKRDPRFWEWEFQEAPAGRAMVFVAEDNGVVVAHFALLPQTYMLDGTPVAAVLAVDAMTAHEYRARGVYTRLHAFALGEAERRFQIGAGYQIRPEALPPLLRNGWKNRLRLPVLVRPLSWRALVQRLAGRRTPPAAVAISGRPQLERTAMAELAAVAAEFMEPADVYQQRSSDFFTWRYLTSPIWKYDMVAGRSDGSIVAYVITRRTVLKGFSTLALVDIGWRRGHDRVAKTLLRETFRRETAAGTELTAALISRAHPAFPLLLRFGLMPGPHRFQFLLRSFHQPTMERLNQARWALMWGDTDHL